MSHDTTLVPGILTPEDVEFLGRPLHGFFTVAAGAVPPQPRPVWFEVSAEQAVELITEPGAAKVRRLHTDPRASLVVTTPVGERERWLSVAGRTTIESAGAHDLTARLAARYWDLRDATRAAELEAMLGADLLRVVIHPEKVARYSMT
ncbi:pyridoxamine 5'-phosphate oxidase family protein [Mycobacterium sp. AMU20-3851]|uniref:pyridoxamine 5'-phosphate oxidase family protein n=1 Tax=Mycobacterium sp. AMU20-3851 TaxID=3122055 RepID=UPI003754FF5F